MVSSGECRECQMLGEVVPHSRAPVLFSKKKSRPQRPFLTLPFRNPPVIEKGFVHCFHGFHGNFLASALMANYVERMFYMLGESYETCHSIHARFNSPNA